MMGVGLAGAQPNRSPWMLGPSAAAGTRRWLLADANPDRAFWASAAGLDDARVRDGAKRVLGGT